MAAKKNEKAAMATAAELRDMSVEAQLEKTSELKAMRRQVARISTVLTEKE